MRRHLKVTVPWKNILYRILNPSSTLQASLEITKGHRDHKNVHDRCKEISFCLGSDIIICFVLPHAGVKNIVRYPKGFVI